MKALKSRRKWNHPMKLRMRWKRCQNPNVIAPFCYTSISVQKPKRRIICNWFQTKACYNWKSQNKNVTQSFLKTIGHRNQIELMVLVLCVVVKCNMPMQSPRLGLNSALEYWKSSSKNYNFKHPPSLLNPETKTSTSAHHSNKGKNASVEWNQAQKWRHNV